MDSSDLKRLRESLNLSQEDVADITSTSVRTVKSWEYGERNISKSAEKLLRVHCESIENTTHSGNKEKLNFEKQSIEEKLNCLRQDNISLKEKIELLEKKSEIAQEINRVYLKAIMAHLSVGEDLNQELGTLESELKKISSN